jgi:hypothetical protein
MTCMLHPSYSIFIHAHNSRVITPARLTALLTNAIPKQHKHKSGCRSFWSSQASRTGTTAVPTNNTTHCYLSLINQNNCESKRTTTHTCLAIALSFLTTNKSSANYLLHSLPPTNQPPIYYNNITSTRWIDWERKEVSTVVVQQTQT